MAVIITTSPEAVLLSKNPINFSLDTENFLSSEGVKSSSRWGLLSNPGIGDTLKFESPSFSGGEILFSFVAAPDDSGTELPAYVSGSSYQYLLSLIPFLLVNLSVNEFYEIYSDGSASLTFKALQYGPDFTITLTHTGYTANPTGDVAGVHFWYDADFRVRARVVLDKGYGDKIYSDYVYKIPEDDGTLEWNFSAIVDELFPIDQLSLFTLATGFNFISPPDTGTVKMSIEFSEYYGDTPTENPITISENIAISKGGFRSYDKAESLIDEFRVKSKFLTHQPEGVLIAQDAFHWLHFINTDPSQSITDLVLAYTIYFTDGTNSVDLAFSSVDPLYSSSQYSENNIWAVPAGYDQLLLNVIHAGKTPYKYSLRVIDNSLNILASMLFNILEPSKMMLMVGYYNSFGVAETICFSGEREMKSSADYESLKLPENNNPLSSDLIDFDFNHRLKSGIEISTGSIPKKQTQALQDLLISPNVFLMVRDGALTKRIAVRVESPEITAGVKDFKNTNNLPAKIIFSLNEETAFSNINKVWQ